MAIQAIDSIALQQQLQTDPSSMFVLDVREADEVARCRIEPSVWIPLSQIPSRLTEIPMDKPLVIYCHSGVRSQHVANFLEAQGFDLEPIYNLTGGIDAWAQNVDPTMARY